VVVLEVATAVAGVFFVSVILRSFVLTLVLGSASSASRSRSLSSFASSSLSLRLRAA
jgi:hypothetical protein